MGSVPPSWEEWNNPDLMRRRIRRNNIMRAAVLAAGVALAFIMLGLIR